MIKTNDLSSFPQIVLEALRVNEVELLSWARKEKQLDDSDAPDSEDTILRANPWHEIKQNLIENTLPNLIEESEFRLLHYSRLLDSEITSIASSGMRPTSKEFLSDRLRTACSEGKISDADSKEILAKSVLNDPSQWVREGEICFVSAPKPHSNSGISPLLGHWGGEMAHFWLQNAELKAKLTHIGRPCVIECSIRLERDLDKVRASCAILNQFLKLRVEWSEPSECEFHFRRAITASEVLDCHVSGSASFASLEKGYWP